MYICFQYVEVISVIVMPHSGFGLLGKRPSNHASNYAVQAKIIKQHNIHVTVNRKYTFLDRTQVLVVKNFLQLCLSYPEFRKLVAVFP